MAKKSIKNAEIAQFLVDFLLFQSIIIRAKLKKGMIKGEC
jgi:hypothetical protein